MDNLQDRQDVPIWNAIEAKNFKQALKLVDKRLAKKPTDYLEALKIYIRSLSPQIPEKSAVLLHLEDVVARKSVLSDLAAIELYEDALEAVLPGSRESWIKIIGELRWRCVKATPKNEDVSLTCFQTCLSKDDLDHARQIANSLEKNFPTNHSYTFWSITSMFLFATSSQCPDNQRKIWGGLASGQILKMAAATRQATDPKQLPTKSIHTPQELFLLDRITEAFGKPEQRLEHLQDSRLGPDSAVAKGEWGLWRLKLRLMSEAKQWKDLFQLCGTLLERARTANDSNHLAEASFSDWMVWEAYFMSASKLEGDRYYDKVCNEVEAHLDPACKIDKSWKRNASLARVKLVFESSKAFCDGHLIDGEISTAMDKIGAVVEYLREYGDANTAYNDLAQFVEILESNQRARLLSILEENTTLEKLQKPIGPLDSEVEGTAKSGALSTASQITRAVNRIKLKYLILSSIPEHERRASFAKEQGFKCSSCSSDCSLFCHQCLALLAGESIKSYQLAISDDGQITKSLLSTDRHPADDLCVLAAICLIKLGLGDPIPGSDHLRDPKTTYLLQAIVLLESAWSRSKPNFQINLMLVRLYSYLGCGSLAMRAYQRLFLKQVQLDTLSYTMFDRVSSLHPHPISDLSDGSSNTRTLIQQLQKQQKLYKSSREHISKNTWLAFKHGSYNSIFEFREVSQKLSYSISAIMSVVESNKIYRFTTNTVPADAITQMYDLIPTGLESGESTLLDNNDYESFPNFESSRAPPFEKLSRFFSGPSSSRYQMNLLVEKIMVIVDPSPEMTGERNIQQQSLKRHVGSLKESWVLGAKFATRSEQLAGYAYHAMALIITESSDQGFPSEADLKMRLESLHQEVYNRLVEQTELIGAMQSVVPAFQTALNSIYTAYELGRTATHLSKFLARKGKAYEDQAELNKQLATAAEKLIQAVVERCAFIRKGMGEGGWIDKVLDGVVPAGSESPSASLTEAIKLISNEVFMEEWAGEVVESWKDSIAGFSYIKVPAKA